MNWLIISIQIITLSICQQKAKFLFSSDESLQNIIYDETSRRVFIGGTNQIIRLSDTLQENKRLSTGPYLDSTDCYYGIRCGEKTMSDNINKILLISQGQLIHCGSLFGGRCNASEMMTLKISEYKSSVNTSREFWVAGGRGNTMAVSSSGLDNNQGMFVATNNGYNSGRGASLTSYYLNVLNSAQMFMRVPYGWRYANGPFFYYYMFTSTPYFYTVGLQNKKYFISRTCLQDTGRKARYGSNRYKSYIELNFECKSKINGAIAEYPDGIKNVVFGKISVNLANSIGAGKTTSGDEMLVVMFYDKSSKTHAICPLLINELNAKFDASTGTSSRCDHAVRKVGGNPVTLKPLGTVYNQNITTSLLFNIKDDNILVLGTNEGQILKVVLSGQDAIKTNSIQKVSPYPITKLTSSPTRLYGLTKNTVLGHPLGNCGQYSTCETCVDGADPFCGWCLLKSSCTQYSECSEAVDSFLPELWVNSKVSDTQCFPISDVSPAYTRITNNTKIQGTSRELVNALRGRDVVCDWVYSSNRLYVSPALLSDNKIVCTSPNLDSSIIPTGQDNIQVNVQLRLQAATTSFMRFIAAFPLYYCRNNDRCYKCTTSPYDCKWCKDTNLCLHTAESCGPAVSIATQEFQCPMLVANNYTMEQRSDGELSIAAQNIPMSTKGDYKCRIMTDMVGLIETQATSSQTSPSKQQIACSVPLNKISITGVPRYIPLVVTYKDVEILNPNNSAQLVVYSCRSISDCSSCKGLDPSYGCSWCKNNGQCVPLRDCDPVNLLNENKCSDPGPSIVKVYPKTGPLAGGTLVTLEGTDLSIKYEDVSSVTVAGVPCTLQPVNYRVSSRVSCLTQEVNMIRDGNVMIEGVNGRAQSDESFYYQTASIDTVSPLVVLNTGGTNVTLSGSQLTMGFNKSVMLANYPCDIIKSLDKITCRTRSVPDRQQGSVELIIDNARYTSRDLFSYIPVPNITQVFPINSIAGGGILINLTGGNGFKSITSAQIYFTDASVGSNAVSEIMNCQPVSLDTQLVCLTPALKTGEKIVENGRALSISLILENTYTKVLDIPPFVVYPNPEIDLSSEEKKILKAGEKLVIQGQHFDRVPGISVFINGNVTCEDLTVSNKLISCTVPDLLAPADPEEQSRRRRRREAEEEKSDVIEKEIYYQLQLGNYRSPKVYATFVQQVKEKANTMSVIIACVAAGCMVVVLMVAVCLLHRRRLQQKKQFKHLMFNEMERIEQKLAEECKQVFTELQTDLADLNSDFSPATIPFHSFDVYALKILFPAQDEYPVLSAPEDLATNQDNLNIFSTLIKQEKFLLTLVETLDKQRQVSKRDKSNIAALMIVSLMDDMAYTTRILSQLLKKLIRDTVNSDARRVKLLLRRSEHITEKYLSNWLTFNLHSFLLEAAGQPLYVLYRAIKHQVEKGAVDYITGNARYALHEKNLLSTIANSCKLNVMVYLEDDPYLKDTKYTPLKSCQVALLSCDTISQAKAKIIDALYRAVPDSFKPTPNDVDVEWKNGTSSSLRLVDMLHNTQDGWKQLDTLGTLNIDDQAVFHCIPRQSPPPFMSQSGGAPSCNSLLREIENGRVWHLERDVDCDTEGKVISGVKSVPEVFLIRLSATKIPLQKFVDDLFDVIFTPNQGVTNLPPCLKYLMDLLDKEAAANNITDPEIIHTWKNNALPLRYWISIIKSPDVVLDVRKNNNIDSCLSVIAQTYIDATYYEDMTIDKSSQSSRLLYCKEIPTYKAHVREYYGEIQTFHPVSESDIDTAFNKNKATTQLKRESALYELYMYACRFSEELRDSLQGNGYRDLADQFMAISDINTQV